MESLIVTPRNKAEFQLIFDLLQKMRISNRVLTDEEKEDLGLGLLMKEVDRTQKVSREEIMAKLGKP